MLGGQGDGEGNGRGGGGDRRTGREDSKGGALTTADLEEVVVADAHDFFSPVRVRNEAC